MRDRRQCDVRDDRIQHDKHQRGEDAADRERALAAYDPRARRFGVLGGHVAPPVVQMPFRDT